MFDEFLVNSRSQIQNHTNTRHLRLQDFPDGKMVKVNRRNNSVHYRIYQKDQRIRFEIEFVRQAIGHERLESTSSYIENLSDEERRLRMEQIRSPEELTLTNDSVFIRLLE